VILLFLYVFFIIFIYFFESVVVILVLQLKLILFQLADKATYLIFTLFKFLFCSNIYIIKCILQIHFSFISINDFQLF